MRPEVANELRLMRLWMAVAGLSALLLGGTVLARLAWELSAISVMRAVVLHLEALPATELAYLCVACIGAMTLWSAWKVPSEPPARFGDALRAQRLVWAGACAALLVVGAAYVMVLASTGAFPGFHERSGPLRRTASRCPAGRW